MPSRRRSFDVDVDTKPLDRLSRNLRVIARQLPAAVEAGTRAAEAKAILPRARRLAPRRTGALAASLRATPQGVRAGVRYAVYVHYGVPSRGQRPQPFLRLAAMEARGQAVDMTAAAVTALAAKHGFRPGLSSVRAGIGSV